MFKKGDKVKCIKSSEGNSTKDRVYIVEEFIPNNTGNYDLRITKDDTGRSNSYNSVYFELATDELDKLIIDFNKGLDSRKILEEKYGGKCKYMQSGFTVCDSFRSWTTKIERLPEKPRFEPYECSLGLIKLEGTKIVIGCEHFELDFFKDMLKYLLTSNTSDWQHLEQFYQATRKGIKYKTYVLPWSEAETLYNKIKDM